MSPQKAAAKPEKPGVAPPRRSRGRPKATPDSEQMAAIVAVASTLFLAKGYGKTTMGDLAGEAHVSLGSIYRFFPGKSDLFAAVVATHRQTMLDLPGDYDHLPLDEALARIFRIDMDAEASRTRDALMTMFLVESRQVPELEPLLMAHGPEQAKALLIEWFERQKRIGRARVTDASIAASMVMDIVFGAASMKVSDAPDWPGGSDRRGYLLGCFSLLAEGFRPR